jgi:hypothetical protein
MRVLRSEMAKGVAGDHSSLAAEPEIELTSTVEPSIQLLPSLNAIYYNNLKMGSEALSPPKKKKGEKY